MTIGSTLRKCSMKPVIFPLPYITRGTRLVDVNLRKGSNLDVMMLQVLWTVPERVSGPPLSMLLGAALLSLAARFCWQGQRFRLWTVPERVSGPPPLMLPGAALLSLAARFCWQGQHFRLWTVPERVSLDAARRSTREPRGSFLLAGAALQALDGARARFGAPPLDAARRSTFKPRGSFLLAGAALQALDGARARFGAALLSLAARFCWQGQHFRLWTVPERVSRLLLGAALLSLAARFCWQGQRFRLWTVPERVSGPPP